MKGLEELIIESNCGLTKDKFLCRLQGLPLRKLCVTFFGDGEEPLQLSGVTRTALARMPLRELALDFDHYEKSTWYIQEYLQRASGEEDIKLNWQYLRNYSSLRKLKLQFLEINCLQSLSVPSLESLTLDCSRPTDENLKSIQAPALTELNIMNCEDLTEAGVMSALAHFPRLEKLRLEHLCLGRDIYEDHGLLAMLPKSVPRLEILSLNGCSVLKSSEIKSRNPDLMPDGRRISREDVAVLAGLYLKEIYLDGAGLFDDDLVCLLAFPLQKLSLECTRITGTGLSALTSLHLRELSLATGWEVTANGLDEALTSLPHLEKLDVRGCLANKAKCLHKAGKAQLPFIEETITTTTTTTSNNEGLKTQDSGFPLALQAMTLTSEGGEKAQTPLHDL
eukprot:g5499.t1